MTKYCDEFTIEARLRKHDFQFKSTYGLFSPKKIDEGTKLLVKDLEIGNCKKCLDLGCGYGVIGIVMAKLNSQSKIFFVDRDFIAIEYTKQNCKINGVINFETRLSNGFSHLKNLHFDIISANLPSHISNDMLCCLIKDSKEHLVNNTGTFYIVVVSKIVPFIKREIKKVFNNFKVIARGDKHSVLEAC